MESLGRGRARIHKLVSDSSKSASLAGSRPPGPPSNNSPRTGVGRGFSKEVNGDVSNIESGLSSLNTSEANSNLGNLQSPKDTLMRDLEKLKEGTLTKRCLIRSTIDFFSFENDVEFYMDKVVGATLESSLIGKEFAMSLKFLTTHKLYGDSIKKLCFSKLQSTYKDMSIFMEGNTDLPQETKNRLVNLCNLFGQIFFRFRTELKEGERYFVLANPTIICMNYLLRTCGTQELRTLAKMFMMNCKYLYEHYKSKIVELYDEVRSTLVKKELTSEERLWLLCVIELFHVEGNLLPEHIWRFYESQAGKSLWREVSLDKTSDGKVLLLANLPIDFNVDDVKSFDLDPSFYNKNRILDL